MTIEQAYEQHAKLLYHIAHRFYRRFGGDKDVILAEANYHFVTAYRSYEASKGSLSKRVGYVVWRGLLKPIQREASRGKKLRRKEAALDLLGGKEDSGLWRRLQALGPDAREAVKLILEPPAVSDGHLLIDFLMRLGWSGERVRRAIREVRDILR